MDFLFFVFFHFNNLSFHCSCFNINVISFSGIFCCFLVFFYFEYSQFSLLLLGHKAQHELKGRCKARGLFWRQTGHCLGSITVQCPGWWDNLLLGQVYLRNRNINYPHGQSNCDNAGDPVHFYWTWCISSTDAAVCHLESLLSFNSHTNTTRQNILHLFYPSFIVL